MQFEGKSRDSLRKNAGMYGRGAVGGTIAIAHTLCPRAIAVVSVVSAAGAKAHAACFIDQQNNSGGAGHNPVIPTLPL